MDTTSTFLADAGRYDTMRYRRSGRSGLELPMVSLGFWQNFGADRPLDNGTDLAKDLLEITPGFGNETRVGGDAIEEPHADQLPDLPNLCGIGEKLHGASNIWLAIAQWRDQYTGVAPGDSAIRTCP